ncbi:MAG TPA: energy transducer TonB [Chitinophagaceae bacterium]
MNLRKIFISLTFIAISTATSAQQIKQDTSKPAEKPLIIIDGKEYLSNLDSLNRNEISSIDVLKGQAAVALYGEKGKNGVVLIHTKKKSNSSMEKIEVDSTKAKNKIRPVADDENIIFSKTEVEASFPGGDEGWKKFLMKNLNASVPSENGAPRGSYTIWLQFIVDKEGNLSDIKALTNHGFGMEEECLRLMKQSPKWIPAMQNGRVVKAYKKQPITFVIES